MAVLLPGTGSVAPAGGATVATLTRSPVAVELTYGLERIAMFLQKVDNVFDLEWAPGVRYRDVRLREEVEQSKYAFNQDTVVLVDDGAHGALLAAVLAGEHDDFVTTLDLRRH